MKFVLGIKPTIITGWGTTFHAKARIRASIRGCFCYSSNKYSFPIEMFKLLNVEITQGNRTFKITPKKK